MKKDTTEDGWQGFLDLCATVKSPQDFGQLFDLFLTIEEKESLAARYLITKALLEKRLTQRKISEIYKVSIAQITRGSNALKVINTKLKKFLEKQFNVAS